MDALAASHPAGEALRRAAARLRAARAVLRADLDANEGWPGNAPVEAFKAAFGVAATLFNTARKTR